MMEHYDMIIEAFGKLGAFAKRAMLRHHGASNR